MAGKCLCGAVFLSPLEVAGQLNVHPSRVQAILARRPWRLGALRLGRGWIMPQAAVQNFCANPTGIHLEGDPPSRPAPPLSCPDCGQRLFTPAEAAAKLGVSAQRIHVVLSRRAPAMQAFRVGRRWVIPQSGLEGFKRQRSQIAEAQSRILELVAGVAPRDWTTRELAAEAARRGRPVSVRKLQRLCQEGRLPAERPGRDWMVPDAAARRWLLGWAGGEKKVNHPSAKSRELEETSPQA